MNFFFSSRRRHTRYWRDWSSDVCSSDLVGLDLLLLEVEADERASDEVRQDCPGDRIGDHEPDQEAGDHEAVGPRDHEEIGRASCRESVDLGGRRIIKKNKKGNERQIRVD